MRILKTNYYGTGMFYIAFAEVDALTEVRQEEKRKKRRKQTAVVGDMKPLEDSLPTLELLLKDAGGHTHPKQAK